MQHDVDQLASAATRVEVNDIALVDASLSGDLARVQALLKEGANIEATAFDGLTALDAIAKGQSAADSWKTEQLASIDGAKKPKAQLLLIPAPAVQKLIEAAATGGACSTAKP